jgi:hypothetical protein
LKSCLFGYAKDNPSHEFFRTQILGVHSNKYSGTRTLYTNNLAFAKEYLKKQLKALETPGDHERIFKALTQRFRFNLHELSDEIDVCVAFETMNNRGKPLSRLELLKNRLIYLSTLSDRPDAERSKVRANLNEVWRTVYEELGSDPLEALDDDEFLRAHWIVFFGYDKDEADPLTEFLLNKHFTAERLKSKKLTLAGIQAYADSLQVSVRVWQQLHFPENQGALLDGDVTRALVRLKRLGFGVLRPLLLAVLSTEPEPDSLLPVLHQAERFLLLVRSFTGTRSNVAEPDSNRLAHEIHTRSQGISSAASMLSERVSRHFSLEAFQAAINELFGSEEGKGFYGLPGLKFMLFEYEEFLQKKGKNSESKITWREFSRSKDSVEHVYPQSPKPGEWPLFSNFTSERRRFLTHSLGNLVAVTVGKNASLSRRSFSAKKKGTDTSPGFSQGSFSELRIAQNDDWTPSVILKRGLEMLRFLEDRWEVDLGSDKELTTLLGLEFELDASTVPENTNVVLTRDAWITRADCPASVDEIPVRDGDEVVAVVPGSTVDQVVFLADDGTAYTMRINDVPAMPAYGVPLAQFFDLGDQARVIAVITTDERFTSSGHLPADDEAGPYLLVATASGLVLRTPLAPFRTPLAIAQRRYIRLAEGDQVVFATLVKDERTIYLASTNGRVIQFSIEDVNILSGAARGVIGIRLDEGDVCLGGALMGGLIDTFVLETSGGRTMEFGPAKYEVVSRGGRGFEAIKRTKFVRVIPPPIQLVDWSAVGTEPSDYETDDG